MSVLCISFANTSISLDNLVDNMYISAMPYVQNMVFFYSTISKSDLEANDYFVGCASFAWFSNISGTQPSGTYLEGAHLDYIYHDCIVVYEVHFLQTLLFLFKSSAVWQSVEFWLLCFVTKFRSIIVATMHSFLRPYYRIGKSSANDHFYLDCWG